MSIFLDTQDRQAIAAAAAARAREAEIARQQAEAKAKAEAAAKARAEAAAKAKAEAEAKAKAEAAAKAQAARNRPLFMIPMANPAKPPFIGPVAPQKPGLLFMAPAATPPKPGDPGFIGPVAVKPDPAQANAAFRAQERKDAQDAERKSPTSMTSAMEETRSARVEVDKALKADSNKGSKETRAALESATARYGEAMQQQVRIATWQAQTRGEDDKGVKKAIEEQANAASEIGNDGGPNEMKPLAKMVADIGKEEWANQRNADVRAVQIEQVGTLRSVDPAALQAKAETDAQRVKDLQGAPGYAQESAQKQAKQSALEYAKVVAKNDGFVTKAADLLLKDAGVSLSQAQIKGDPIATAAAQKDYDQKLEAAKQASTQAELSQSMATALQNDQDATAAQKAYLDAHPGMPSGGYALLPPSDLKQKILDGNSKTAGDAGTQGDGDGIYKLSNGSRVQRLSDGQWKVLDVGKDIEPGIKKNQLLDPLTAKVWETQYQAAQSSVALDSAWTYANRQLPPAADGSQPQMPAMTADLSGQLAADKKAMQDAEALAKIQGPFTNQALQKHKDDLEIAKAKLELTDQLIQWQKTDKDYQAAKRTDSSQMCLAKTDEEYRDLTDDAFVRVQRAQANLELAQSKANTAQAKIALDATPQYEPPPAGAKPLTQAQPAIPPMIAAPTLNNLNSPAGSPFIGPVQKGATPPLLLTQPLLQPQPQPQVPTAAWQAANDRYNQAVQAQDQGQKKFEQAQGSEFLTSRLSTTELYDAEAVKRALAPPEEKKESHRSDSILEMVVGGLEVAGGVMMIGAGVATSWTGVGIGLVAAGALVTADGATRTVHGAVDTAKDEKTDPYLSQGLQQMGVDQTVANRIDTGVGLTAGLVSGGPGTVKLGVQGIRALNGVRVASQAGEAFTVAQVAGAGGKVLAGAGSTAMLADMSYAQGSYALTGEMKTPLGTQGLMKMGLSETQANYVQVLGGLGVGAGASTVKWAAPKVKAATTARNATAGAAATQVVAGQQGATAPGTAPAGTTGTTTTTTTTGTTPASATTGTTPAGHPPAVREAAEVDIVQDPNAMHVNNARLLEGGAADDGAVARPRFVGQKQGIDLRPGAISRGTPTAAQLNQIKDILGPSPDGSFTAKGLRRFAPRGLQPDKVPRIFVVSTDRSPMKNGRPLTLRPGMQVHTRQAEAVKAAAQLAASSKAGQSLVYAVQDHGRSLPAQLRRGRFGHDALLGAVAVDSAGGVFAQSWANRRHSDFIPRPGQAFRKPLQPLTRKNAVKLITLHAGIDAGASAAAFGAAHALGWSAHGATAAALTAAGASAYRKIIPSLQIHAQHRMTRANTALLSMLDRGAVSTPEVGPLNLALRYRKILVGPRTQAGEPVGGGFGVPMARRVRYNEAIEALRQDPGDAAALATLKAAGVDLYRTQVDKAVQRSAASLGPKARQDLVAAWQRLRGADDLAQAAPKDWKTLQDAVLDDMVARHSGVSALKVGLTAGNDYRLAAEVLRLNPMDAGARALVKGAAGNTFRINTPAGFAAALLQALSYGASRERGLDGWKLGDASPQPVVAEAYNTASHAGKTARSAEELLGADITQAPRPPKAYRPNQGAKRWLLSLDPRDWPLVEHGGGMAKPGFFNGRIQLAANRLGEGVYASASVHDIVAGVEALAGHRHAEAALHFGSGLGKGVMARGIHKDNINAYRKTRGLGGVQYVSPWMRSFADLPRQGTVVVKGLPPASLILVGAAGVLAADLAAAALPDPPGRDPGADPVKPAAPAVPTIPAVPVPPAGTLSPKAPVPVAPPLPRQRVVAVDHRRPDTATLEGIAYANRRHLPDQPALAKAQEDGAVALRSEALRQLVQLNPQRHFDLDRMDGVVAPQPEGDPDFLRDGWLILAGRG